MKFEHTNKYDFNVQESTDCVAKYLQWQTEGNGQPAALNAHGVQDATVEYPLCLRIQTAALTRCGFVSVFYRFFHNGQRKSNY